MHHCEDGLVGVISPLCCDNLRHGDRHDDVCDRVSLRALVSVHVNSWDHFYLFTFVVVKSVAVVWADARLQVSGYVNIYSAELKVVFVVR